MDPRHGRLLVQGAETTDRLRPLSYPSPEREQLAAAIHRAIQQETHGGIWNLQVSVTRDEILLFGYCTTYYLKQLAQHAAMTLAGGVGIVNLIEVR